MVSDDVVESVSSSKFHADPKKENNKTDWIANYQIYKKTNKKNNDNNWDWHDRKCHNQESTNGTMSMEKVL